MNGARILKTLGALAAIALVVVFGRQAGGYFFEFAEWVKAQGPLGPVIFIGAYAVGTVAAAPGGILTMLGGAIFGLLGGTIWVFCGAVLGSSAAFLISRYVARDALEKKIRTNPKFAAIDRAVGDEGLKIVFLLRLTPVFPFSFGNYALGLTRVSFRDYVLASFGILPGTFLYVYYGKTAGDIAALASGNAQVGGGTGQQILMVVGLVATILVTLVITKVAKKALDKASGETVKNDAVENDATPEIKGEEPDEQ